VTRSELDAAGIHGEQLRASYSLCRQLNSAHGKTYYLATLLLPRAKRPHVHALYGFARFADEIVDDLATHPDPAERARALAAFTSEVTADLEAGRSAHPITRALIHTMGRFGIRPEYISAFLDSMRMDLTIAGYPDFAALMKYVYGSAAVIGLQMLPILEHPGVPREEVEPYASDLGVAFQLANFIRDVGEDLDRGRVYLPQEDLDAFGVDRARLARGTVDLPVRRLLRFEVARARGLFRAAEPGIGMLHPSSRDCMRTAFVLYGGILTEIERNGYQVLTQRVRVGAPRRAAVALPALFRATWARARFS
jgi:phytoene synthase